MYHCEELDPWVWFADVCIIVLDLQQCREISLGMLLLARIGNFEHIVVPDHTEGLRGIPESILDPSSALESTIGLVFYWILSAKIYGCNWEQNCQNRVHTLEGTHGAVHTDHQNYCDLTNWCRLYT